MPASTATRIAATVISAFFDTGRFHASAGRAGAPGGGAYCVAWGGGTGCIRWVSSAEE